MSRAEGEFWKRGGLPPLALEPVEGGELLPHVGDPRTGADGAAGGPLDQLVRRELAPVAVNTLAEPGQERRELAPCEAAVQVGQVAARRRHQLRADQVAQRVAVEGAQRVRP